MSLGTSHNPTENRGKRRQFLRAPLRREILFENDGYVFKAFASNISEGGLLITELPMIPSINALPIMIGLPQYPDFASLSSEKLNNLKVQEFEYKIVRAKAKIVRSFDGLSEVDVVMTKKMGCEFVVLTDLDRQIIREFVSQCAKNIIFVLNYFEGHRGNKEEQAKILRNLCQVLGYTKETKIALLRQKILHDYQSLESR